MDPLGHELLVSAWPESPNAISEGKPAGARGGVQGILAFDGTERENCKAGYSTFTVAFRSVNAQLVLGPAAPRRSSPRRTDRKPPVSCAVSPAGDSMLLVIE